MLADAKQYLKKRNIELKDFQFQNIVELLNRSNNLRYAYMFTLFTYEQRITFRNLENLLNNYIIKYRDSLNKLPQDITKYRSYSHLYDDLFELEKDVFVKRFTNTLPSKLSSLSNEERKELKKILPEFYKLSEAHQTDFIKNVSRFKNVTSVLKNLAKYINEINKVKSYNALIEKVKEHEFTKILYQDDNVMLAEVIEFNDMKKLGSSHWCIARNNLNWRNYVHSTEKDNCNSRQYILWNQKFSKSDPRELVAFTLKGLDKANGLHGFEYSYVAHDRRNTSFNLLEYLKQNDLTFLIKYLSLKPNVEKLGDAINSLKKGYAVPGWFSDRFKEINISSINFDELEKYLIERETTDNAMVKFLQVAKFEKDFRLQKLIVKMFPDSKNYWKYFFDSICSKKSFNSKSYDIKDIFETYLNQKHSKSSVKLFNVEKILLTVKKAWLKRLDKNLLLKFVVLNQKHLSYDEAMKIVSVNNSIKQKNFVTDLYQNKVLKKVKIEKKPEKELVTA